MNIDGNEIENGETNYDVKTPTTEKQRIYAKDANYVFITSIFVQIIIGLGLGIVAFLVAYIVRFGDETKLYYYFALPLTEFGAIFLPVLFYFLIKKIDYKSTLRLNKIKVKHILPLIIIGISAQYAGGFLNYILIFFLNFLGPVPIQEVPTPKTILELIYTIFFIAAIPAVFEEIMARGIIMRGYEGFGAKRAIIISAFLFGLMHFDLTNLVFPIFLGMLLGYLVFRTNSIFSGMIVHFVNNAYGALILYFLEKSGDTIVEPSNLTDLLYSSIPAVIGLILIGGLVYYIYRTTNDNFEENEILKVEDNVSTLNILLHWPLLIAYGLMIIVIVTTIYKIIFSIN